MRGLKRLFNIACVGAIMLCVCASCGSKKSVLRTDNGQNLTLYEHLDAVIENAPQFETFSSKLKMDLPVKRGGYTVNGTLKIQKDQMIQISLLVPIIRSEAARIEITPKRVLVIDRIHKRYADVAVAELSSVFQTEVDFSILQALFTNTIFKPGKKQISAKDFDAFMMTMLPGNELMLFQNGRKLSYAFKIGLEDNRLLSSSISTLSSGYMLAWVYDEFTGVGNTVFPSQIKVLVGNKTAPRITTMELSRMQVEKQELAPTTPPARYEKLSLNEVLTILENL